jgi:hypothetical protein
MLIKNKTFVSIFVSLIIVIKSLVKRFFQSYRIWEKSVQDIRCHPLCIQTKGKRTEHLLF